MTVVGLNPKITWQVTCQFCFWCLEINETLQLSFQRNVTLNLFYLWWSFHGQCYLDRKLKAISSKGVLEGAGEGVTIGLTCACTGCTACVFNFHLIWPTGGADWDVNLDSLFCHCIIQPGRSAYRSLDLRSLSWFTFNQKWSQISLFAFLFGTNS